MNIRDLKIGTQLKLGFGLILLLILILGALSWWQSNQIAQQTDDLYNHPLKVRRALSDIKTDALSIRVEFLNILLSNDDPARHASLTNMTLLQADAEQNFNILSSQYLGPKTDVEEAHNAFINWTSSLEGFKNEVFADKSKDELNRLDERIELEKIGQKVFETIKKIDVFALKKGDLLYSSSIILEQTLSRQLATILVSILILSFLIIAILIRNFDRPVSEMIRVTQLFAKGKMETRSSYFSGNEFGDLSSSFNNLAEILEKEMSFRDRASKLNNGMLKGLESKNPINQVLGILMKQTNSQVGAVYLINDRNTHFENVESIGMESAKKNSFSASDFEGEFGIALASQNVELIKNIQVDTHHTLATVTCDFRPKEIITIPLLDKQTVVAMISLASLHEFDSQSIRLVSDMQAPLTTWLNALIASKKIQQLGENLKFQNIELESQKKELAAQANELLQQNSELEVQKKQLNESNQLKTNFLSNMSHELRTPLNSVIALSGVLNRKLANKIPDEEYSYLDVIERNGKLLLALINDILDLSRIEAGFEEIQADRFNVNSLVHEVIDLIQSQAQQKNIGLTFEANDNLPIILSDYEKCRHIVQNIVANAIKFTDAGAVSIRTLTDNKSLLVEVSDTGIGIEKEFISQIFEEFRQADNSNSRKHGGTGLGLSIAKKYAAFLGGDITVESEKGKGSKFTLRLPIDHVFSEATGHYEHIHPIYVSGDSRHDKKEHKWGEKTILLVEDSEAAIIQMKEMLSSQGYQVLIAQNGGQALDQIALKTPDALILDLMMPEVDGFEVLRRIRENEVTAQLPVIILTAKYVTKEELAFLKHNHIHQLIQKGDISKDQLLKALSEMIFSEKADNKIPEKKQIIPHQDGDPVILVVEDNPDNMLTIKALLSGYGTILEAIDGLKGIELALEHVPNLILMDIAIPEMNGIEVLRKMRETELLKNVCIIAVSASAMKGDKEHFISCGFDDYISKPIDHQIFEQIITNALGIKR